MLFCTNTLATWCEEPTHWKRPWYWERLKAGGEGYDRGWDGWMASLTQWTWVWASSGRWGRTGKPDVLQSMKSQRVGHDWGTEWQIVPTAGPVHPLRSHFQLVQPWDLRWSGCSWGQFERAVTRTHHATWLAWCTGTSVGQWRGLKTAHLLGWPAGLPSMGNKVTYGPHWPHLPPNRREVAGVWPKACSSQPGKVFLFHLHLKDFFLSLFNFLKDTCLQCCARFCCTVKWISYMCMCKWLLKHCFGFFIRCHIFPPILFHLLGLDKPSGKMGRSQWMIFSALYESLIQTVRSALSEWKQLWVSVPKTTPWGGRYLRMAIMGLRTWSCSGWWFKTAKDMKQNQQRGSTLGWGLGD